MNTESDAETRRHSDPSRADAPARWPVPVCFEATPRGEGRHPPISCERWHLKSKCRRQGRPAAAAAAAVANPGSLRANALRCLSSFFSRLLTPAPLLVFCPLLIT